MTLKLIQDSNGNTTGVFIPIAEWQSLKTKYAGLQNEKIENVAELELAPWQKQIIDDRLIDYYNNPSDVADFDKTIDDIEKKLMI